ncbi:MAG: hypothetical protein U0P30_11170 [Vicinamibacterales bacterium]
MTSSDGRFVISRPSSTDATVLRVVDTETRAFLDVVSDFQPRRAHPRDLAFFGLTSMQTLPSGAFVGVATRLDLGGLHAFDLCPNRSTHQVDITADGATLLARCESGELVVAGAVTGAVRRRTVMPAGSQTMSSTADGAAVYLLADTANAPVELRDTTTGAVVDSITAPAGCISTLAGASSDRSKLILVCRVTPSAPTPSFGLYLFDIAARRFDNMGGVTRGVQISPDNTRMHVIDFRPARLGLPATGNLREVDIASGLTTWNVPFIGEVVVSYAPLAPALGAAVAGGRVDLTWTLPLASPAVTRYVLEIGSGPGQANLGTIDLGTTSSFRATGVPAGTYYVRLRGANYGGTGAVSNELRIDVQ